MSARRRRAIVGALVAGCIGLLFFGRGLFGSASGLAVMVATFVTGFAWLWLLVAPWAVEGRTQRRNGQR